MTQTYEDTAKKAIAAIDAENKAALEYAGECGGNYLESIGKTDLADLTPEQWLKFIDTVVRCHDEKMMACIPF